MAGPLKEWLGPFVAAELAHVLAWNKARTESSSLKKEPEERFNDDGSNFRSTVTSPPLTRDCKVQILSILSSKKPAILRVSDGACSIRATLSEDARTLLEKELEEGLSEDTTGDVVSLTSLTVISTPYGDAEGLVQFSIEELQYHFHLRKKLSNSRAIEETPEVKKLLDEVRRLRTAQYDDEEDGTDVPATQSSAVSNDVVAGTKRKVVASPAPVRRKRPAPSLSKEGYEVEEGVNLARPAAPLQEDRTNNASHQKPAAIGGKGAALLSLLGGPRAAPAEMARSDVDIPKVARPAREQRGAEVSAQVMESTPKILPLQATPRQSTRVPYGRRRIPENQQRLLDSKDSWFPPLPGRRFPAPNVPMELLTIWNAQASQPPPSDTAEATQAGAEEASKNKVILISSSDESSEVSSEESSEAEEISPSQWPPSQPAKGEMLPPDSTLGSRLSGQSVVSPQKLPLRSPVKSQSVLPNGTIGNIPTGPRALQNQPARSLANAFIPNKPSLGNRASEVLIKGTQYSATSDEMEMDVPRPLPDPAVAHRQRRSEHMRAAQRQDWLKANYAYKTTKGAYKEDVHKHYTSTYPKDPVLWTEFSAVIKEVFPLCDKPPNEGIQRLDSVASTGSVNNPGSPQAQLGNQTKPQSLPMVVLKEHREWLQTNCVYRHKSSRSIEDNAEVFARFNARFPGGAAAEQFNKIIRAVFPRYRENAENGIMIRPPAPTPVARPPREPSLEVRTPRPPNTATEADEDLSDGNQVVPTASAEPGSPPAASFERPLALEYDSPTSARPATQRPSTRPIPKQPADTKSRSPASYGYTSEDPRSSVPRSELPAVVRRDRVSLSSTPDQSTATNGAAFSGIEPKARKPPPASTSRTSSIRSAAPTASKAQPASVKAQPHPTSPTIQQEASELGFTIHKDVEPRPEGILKTLRPEVTGVRKPASGGRGASLPMVNSDNPTEQPRRVTTDGGRERGAARITPQLNGSHLQVNTKDTNTSPPETLSTFEDFRQAWKALKPGGAFAQATSRPSRSAFSGVNVLAWQV
ncbi:hypothetical protein LTR56_000304 [Elasticomyces elasticus]|nr:hypothetical protein LTR56_000304 [Elasticomyces elasticus]KAK3667000.1 hypothetical protein LTR22_002225 [Elasticomyces elasticus]KAK4933296.1 hypothetical protein LTR49_000290 [Elasticomyces elasticus]KAK5757350.1 hypothetical protein LTS12_012562 [Elasticomyces elasticus]